MDLLRQYTESLPLTSTKCKHKMKHYTNMDCTIVKLVIVINGGENFMVVETGIPEIKIMTNGIIYILYRVHLTTGRKPISKPQYLDTNKLHRKMSIKLR